MKGQQCSDCGARVELCVTEAGKFEYTRKSYSGDTYSLGEKVRVRLGLACECTTYRGSKLSYDGLESGYFDESVEDWPDNWK